ncbi:hypothetical protein SCACP_08690 [Sporomusa carbonis]|uniref:helix-turn-helix domain-containing protein n=1 Tax=Sporomusa carbonis TaxID=3076075 RepID=UPI003A755ADA
MPSFGEYLKQIMEDRKIGVNALGELSGISGSHISRIINGQRSAPSPKTIKKFATALNTSYEELMQAAGHINSTKDQLPLPQEEKSPKTFKSSCTSKKLCLMVYH